MGQLATPITEVALEVIMNKRNCLYIIAAVVIVAAIVVVGCNDSRTRIANILQRPDDFVSRDVTVGGNVTKTYAVNLIIAEFGAYQVDDGTGKIWVITKNGVPSEGRAVGVRGTVSSGLRLKGEVLGAVIREKDRRVR